MTMTTATSSVYSQTVQHLIWNQWISNSSSEHIRRYHKMDKYSLACVIRYRCTEVPTRNQVPRSSAPYNVILSAHFGLTSFDIEVRCGNYWQQPFIAKRWAGRASAKSTSHDPFACLRLLLSFLVQFPLLITLLTLILKIILTDIPSIL